jgi:hypothetical protein
MDFVKNDHGLGAGPVEQYRIADHLFGLGQIAIDVDGPIRAQAFRQGGLAAATHATQPSDRNLPPSVVYPIDPEGSFNHASEVSKKHYQM